MYYLELVLSENINSHNENPGFVVSKEELLEKILFFTKNDYVVEVTDLTIPPKTEKNEKEK